MPIGGELDIYMLCHPLSSMLIEKNIIFPLRRNGLSMNYGLKSLERWLKNNLED